MTSLSRRRFLGAALGGSAAVLGRGARAAVAIAQTPGAKLAAVPLADRLALITGAGANVVAAGTPQGLLLVDGGLEAHAPALQSFALQQLSCRSVHTLFNTHWHPEQTGSNERLGAAGAEIIAHENTRLWLTRKLVVSWRPGSYGPLPPRALPNKTFYTRARLSVGNDNVDYGYLGQAHTDGDLYAFFREENVLVGGGVVSGDRWPVLDWQTGGWIAGLVGAFDILIQVANDETRVVPANGPLLTRADLKEQRAMYFTIYQRLVHSLNKGLSPDEAVALAPAKEFKPLWGDPQPFLVEAFESMWGHFAPNA